MALWKSARLRFTGSIVNGAAADPEGGPASGLLRQVMQADRGRLMAALIGGLGRFDLAEDALSDALEAALVHWGRSGLPDNPQGWLLRVARRKAIDLIRREKRFGDRVADLARLAAMEQDALADDVSDIPDDRLRLVFTCCHPALEPKSRVALTLRTLGGLTTGEIARAFLDTEATMGQRLSRAKAKIAAAGIPFAIPQADQLAERLGSVLAVIYLIFNEGYSASAGDQPIRVDLCEEAIFLGSMLDVLMPKAPEVMGLQSLMLTTHARRAARVVGGRVIGLDHQNRCDWDRAMIAAGLGLLDQALLLLAPGPYQIKAAISALHVQAQNYGATDWRQMILLYDALLRLEPSPVVRLNRAVVLAEAGGGVPVALAELLELAADLDQYQPFHAAKAELLGRNGDMAGAALAYDRAINLSRTEAERSFLAARRAARIGV